MQLQDSQQNWHCSPVSYSMDQRDAACSITWTWLSSQPHQLKVHSAAKPSLFLQAPSPGRVKGAGAGPPAAAHPTL